MKAKEAYEQRDDVRFVDVREGFEWDAGHIEGAIHVPVQELPERLKELPEGTKVVTICTVGMRATYAAEVLGERGFEAHAMDGGLVAWEQEGLPVVRDDGSAGEVWTS